MEILKEIWHSIRQNKVRTFMSGFGILWGIMILVSLLGVGKGLELGVQDSLKGFSRKTIGVWGGITSKQYKNMNEGRPIVFDKYLLKDIERRFSEVKGVSPMSAVSKNVIFEKRNTSASVSGVTSQYFEMISPKMRDGSRKFNPSDDRNARNIAIIGKKVATNLFGSAQPIDKMINVGGVYYTIVGVMRNDDIITQQDENYVYIPHTSFIRNIQDTPDIQGFSLYLKDEAEVSPSIFAKKLKNYLANKLNFANDDDRAIYIQAIEENLNAISGVFNGLSIFIWIVGICFLISGMISISNIMFIIVKERTSEIGIRMAVGATPSNIIWQILIEALSITLLSGIIGTLLAFGILQLIDFVLSAGGESSFPLKRTVFDFGVAFGALVIMTISGVLAGLFPAIKASNIQPVDAIRHENRG
ncbi:ABC transporter permease [Capnocytophaga catalasegens]|uniref:ABC transporter ATP-binding protein n=1 Tax=Capnocytophaga catalasegens TaxID=1004260 RepID=A0AAV5AT53_9FLAO|nr:ABC transporter permease [Capnocytophaga catalasegens]GIZ15984.1 ABC transporter ATP-binding protein [Capnocytophaga catalasegens]GJM50471.1 ABC transporter ATP-binding protein [Capnocytophaga catalasegens]GJM53966.1 ABC transporter ATP-binding protein [Capnocytophaga catalasegens]